MLKNCTMSRAKIRFIGASAIGTWYTNHMKSLKLSKKQMDIIVLIFLAVAVLAVSLILALLGSRVYENSSADERQQEVCTAAAYFTDRLRECESFSNVRTASLGGERPALVISDTSKASETARETWYFVYDGQLMRTSVDAGKTVSPESGEPVMALKSAAFRILQNGLLEITIVTQAGERSTVNVYIADGGGGSDE